ncbi:glycosyltransferase family 2 protein [Lacticaseibacillus casei]|nr:glycosyltransferase family 2 protein [Lacticaseibacillus casei]
MTKLGFGVTFVMKQSRKLRIAVLVATYNGERFIEQQLDSILKQKGITNYDYQVFVYDDGSQDGTGKILSKYGDDIRIIPKDPKYQGIKSAIYSLLHQVEADIYYFSDQDDVWAPDKVIQMQSAWKKLKQTEPGGVYSDLLLVDGQNHTLGKTMMSANGWGSDEERDLSFLILNPRVTGAAFSINRAARDLVLQLPKSEFLKVTMHDSFLALLTSSFNNLAFLPKPLVRYRQHGSNQIGAKRTIWQEINVLKRLSSLQKRLEDIAILQELISELPTSVQSRVKIYANFAMRKNPFTRIALVLKNRVCWEHTPILKILIILFTGVSARRIL